MIDNFNSPQKQSSIGVVIMFVNTLQHYIKAFLPFLLVWAFKSDDLNKTYALVGCIVLILSVGLVAYLKYINFTFYIDDKNDEFIINEGIINKTKTTIQLNKIQQVNINQSLIHRLIGVYALVIDTAGSSNKEGNIKAISNELAVALKAKLQSNEGKSRIDSPEEITVSETNTNTYPFLEISFFSLIKVGLTSNYLKSFLLILTFFFTIYINLKEVAYNSNIDKEIGEFFNNDKVLNSISVIIVIALFAIFVFNILRSIISYFGYKITKQNGSLLLSYGLIATKTTILKPEKVQIVSVSRNYFQKKLDILELKITQATGKDAESKKALIEIPGCNTIESNNILHLLFNQIPQKGEMLLANWRKLGFSIFILIVLPVFVFFALGNYIEKSILEYANYAFLYAIFIGLILIFEYRNYRLFVNDDFIIKQSGAWDVGNQIIEVKKIQGITTSQLFWHKPLNIGSVTLHSAGGAIAFHLGDYNKIVELVNLWLYEIESSDTNWS